MRIVAVNRRLFLQIAGVGTASAVALPAAAQGQSAAPRQFASDSATTGFVRVARFDDGGTGWTVWEDRRSPEGAIRFVSATGEAITLTKRLEAAYADDGPAYLGMDLATIAMADADLLAEALLAKGDPDPEQVRRAAPPLASALKMDEFGTRMPWTGFVGTRQAGDTMPIFPNGRSRTYRPEHDFPPLTGDRLAPRRKEGMLGGWLPAIHKVIERPEGGHYDLLCFADVDYQGRFYVHTWHRTQQIESGRIVKETFGDSHADFAPRRFDPAADAYYRALLRFARYWAAELDDLVPVTLPDPIWGDMVAHAFAKEIIVRPGGVYPKYGVVDRDYYGSEYDGFQDTFTSSLSANLEWGRFAQARAVLDQFFDEFVANDGMVDMRGPQVGQFGLTLSLVARYLHLTGDEATVRRHASKLRETAALLAELHDIALKLPASDPEHGLIAGWNESDACLFPDPSLWWKPYFANSAFAVRGWRDLAEIADRIGAGDPAALTARADRLNQRLIESLRANIRRDLSPPYVGPLPGRKDTFREALAKGQSEQGWPHRVYAELLHADVLPADLAHLVIDCLKGHGGTTLGVVANITRARPGGRDILGFISYGYAMQLLRLDRISEYLLFLYSHRYHNHTPGGWVAGEVSGITGMMPIFCIPAQLTIPKLVRWMLVFEDGDGLHLLRATPRDWLTSGKPVAITGAPTRWGKVDVRMTGGSGLIEGEVVLHDAAAPATWLTLRLPKGAKLTEVTANGAPLKIDGEKVRLPRAPGRMTITARYTG